MKKENNKQKGQALFEFILFVPFMLSVYTLTVSFTSAINGSINQQKATRGYFYARSLNNSYFPSREVLSSLDGVQYAGQVVIGWKRVLDGRVPVAPCFKLRSLVSSELSDQCETEFDEGTTSTKYIRPKTMYGYCGATYFVGESGGFERAFHQATPTSCQYSSAALN